MHAELPSPSRQLINTLLSLHVFGRETDLQPGCLLVGSFPSSNPAHHRILTSMSSTLVGHGEQLSTTRLPLSLPTLHRFTAV